MEDFYRIRRLPPYVFEQVNRAKAAARNAGADIIDLGMGNPDLPTPPHVIEKMKETLGKPRTDRYSASRGITGLRRAQAAYYDRRFGVKLNPETQIVATLGSKEGFANVAQAITAPGDVVLCPNPSYPIHAILAVRAWALSRIQHRPGRVGLNRKYVSERTENPEHSCYRNCHLAIEQASGARFVRRISRSPRRT